MNPVGTASAADLLALHGVRILGFAGSGEVAARYGLTREAVEEPGWR